MTTSDWKQYEPVLQKINSKFITSRRKNYREIVELFLNDIIIKLKEKSLFNGIYQKIFYGGSYFDDLKVGDPTEFDIDLLFTIPKQLDHVVKTSNIPGYVQIQFTRPLNVSEKNKDFVAKFINDKLLLDKEMILSWMESNVRLALNNFYKANNDYIICYNNDNFYIKCVKSGPAFTINLDNRKGIVIDIDLVPSFVFSYDKLPKEGFRQGSRNLSFFIIPKRLLKKENTSTYWRLSFQEQEREIMKNKQTLKPTIKLLKKMRDNFNHIPIRSYFIKTILLWQIDNYDDNFWNKQPLSTVFMKMLEVYLEHLGTNKIQYYWYKKNNLLSTINAQATFNMKNQIEKIIKIMKRSPTEPILICHLFLNPQEMYSLQNSPYEEPDMKKQEESCTLL